MAHGFYTRFVHSGPGPDSMGAVMPPLYRAVSYHQEDPWNPPPYDYARSGNPTRAALEQAVAELEGGCQGFAFASGSAALTAVCFLFAAGDHLVVTRDCQGGTQRLFRDIWARFGLRVTYVDTDRPEAVAAAWEADTRALWVENFSNPFLAVSPVPELAALAHERGGWLLVDNTFVTPAGQTPLRLGADIVMHSASKLIAGHADVTAGLVAVRDPALGERLYRIQNATGGVLSPDDAYQVLRGFKTLPLRLERAAAGAARLAPWLAAHPRVAAVYYPGLPDHPGHATARATMRGFGHVISFVVAGGDMQWVRRLRLIQVGAGFGGTQSMLSLPVQHCHAALTAAERRERGIAETLARLSVGLEDPEDLVEDLAQALQS